LAPITSKRLGSYIAGGRGVYLDETGWRKDAKLAKELQLGIVRFNSDVWDILEPRPGQFDWKALDKIVEILGAENIQILFTLPISNKWNFTGKEGRWWGRKVARSHHLATDLKTVDRFVETLATRYRGKINYYELWNEQDFAPYWKGKPDAAEYLEFVKVAYPAIKRGNPKATVLMGGLANPTDDKWLKDFYRLGGDQYFDVMNIHVYPVFGTLENALRTVRGKKPIWITETSTTGLYFETKDTEKEEREKAYFLVRNYATALSQPDVERIFWHCVRNPGRDVGLPKDYDFGLMTSAGEPLPAHKALLVFNQKLMGSQPMGLVNGENPNLVVYRFETKLKTIFVAWSKSGEAAFGVAADGAKVFDWRGDAQSGALQKRTVTVGTAPIYIELKKS
jgi:hypothetical protein